MAIDSELHISTEHTDILAVRQQLDAAKQSYVDSLDAIQEGTFDNLVNNYGGLTIVDTAYYAAMYGRPYEDVDQEVRKLHEDMGQFAEAAHGKSVTRVLPEDDFINSVRDTPVVAEMACVPAHYMVEGFEHGLVYKVSRLNPTDASRRGEVFLRVAGLKRPRPDLLSHPYQTQRHKTFPAELEGLMLLSSHNYHVPSPLDTRTGSGFDDPISHLDTLKLGVQAAYEAGPAPNFWRPDLEENYRKTLHELYAQVTAVYSTE